MSLLDLQLSQGVKTSNDSYLNDIALIGSGFLIFPHIDTWCSNNSINNFKYTYVFDIENNRDDRILYNRLCEKDRADVLEERFIKENEEMK